MHSSLQRFCCFKSRTSAINFFLGDARWCPQCAAAEHIGSAGSRVKSFHGSRLIYSKIRSEQRSCCLFSGFISENILINLFFCSLNFWLIFSAQYKADVTDAIFLSGHSCRDTEQDFADTSHSESARSATTTASYGIFSSENSYPRKAAVFPLQNLPDRAHDCDAVHSGSL